MIRYLEEEKEKGMSMCILTLTCNIRSLPPIHVRVDMGVGVASYLFLNKWTRGSIIYQVLDAYYV